MPYPVSTTRLDKKAIIQKWGEYLLHAHEARIGKRAKPPLVVLKYHLDGILTELPPV
jgi:hypothetical protein